MEFIFIALYLASLLFLAGNSLLQAKLAIHFNRPQRPAPIWPAESRTDFPTITVQLPVYNELYVIERLLGAVARFDYPKHLLEIQVLDDSTDETSSLIARCLNRIRQSGFLVEHLRRPDRTGFKAGALAEGMKRAKGELIAIFDADFVPAPDFLRRLIPYFADPKTGLVQARWEHLNPSASLLTRFQAFFLDAHLFAEQRGRDSAGHLINFNGTAGIWRKTCIEDAGGWQSDTLTEDLDLSYRAQLRGWQLRYTGEVSAPAELPVSLQALKTQQYRWMKGIAECARKHLLLTMQSGRLSAASKIYAFFHLFSSLPFICLLLLGVASVPALWLRQQLPYRELFEVVSWLSLLSLAAIALYWAAFRYRHAGEKYLLLRFMAHYLLFIVVSLGLSFHNARAVLEGLLGRKTPFVRTPKFNLNAERPAWENNRYLRGQPGAFPLWEVLMGLYFLGGAGLAVWLQDYGMLPLHLLFSSGFGLVSYYSLVQTRAVVGQQRKHADGIWPVLGTPP